jgi:hypothetical protein
MASKQSASKKTSVNTTATGAASAPAKAVRTSKPKTVENPAVKALPEPVATEAPAPAITPRVKSARHSKPAAIPVVSEARASNTVAVPEVPAAVVGPTVSAHEAISKLAYGYWVARGYRDGNPQEDWLRAEREYLSRQ